MYWLEFKQTGEIMSLKSVVERFCNKSNKKRLENKVHEAGHLMYKINDQMELLGWHISNLTLSSPPSQFFDHKITAKEITAGTSQKIEKVIDILFEALGDVLKEQQEK